MFESLIGKISELNFVSLKLISNLSFFQNLKKYPTKKADKMCEISNIMPIFLLPNNAIPTSS